jgi:hypothetical protein
MAIAQTVAKILLSLKNNFCFFEKATPEAFLKILQKCFKTKKIVANGWIGL